MPKVETIGYNAFYYFSEYVNGSYINHSCTSLKHVDLSSVTSIGSYAFDNCSNISSLRIGSAEQWCNVTFGNSYSNPLYVASKPVDLYVGDSDKPATELTIPASVQQIPQYFYKGTDVLTIHFEGTTPPALTSTNSFPSWTMLAVPEDAYETYLAANVYKTIPLQITKDGHLTRDIEMEADNGTSKLLEKIGEDEVRHVVNLKITGSINSYDMLIIRNQMTSLRNLDLTDANIVDCDYIYSNKDGNAYHSIKDNVTGDWLSNVMNLKLPVTTKAIGDKAFYNCRNLVSVNIPDGVTSIGSYAFYNCDRIKELTLPQSVTSFGSYAFQYCTGLKEVVIPDGVTSVGGYAFQDCTDLEKVTIPASVISIGRRAFDVRKPIELHIEDLDAWREVQISGNYYDGSAFSNVNKLYIGDSAEPVEEIEIPAGTTAIKDYTFAGFKCIKSFTLPNEVESMGAGAFYGCSGISEILLPEKLKAINYSTFSGCTKLTKIELPAYLETIGSYAFQNCSNLSEVLIPASIKSVADYAFSGCSNLKTVIATTVEPIVINQNTFSTYQTATVYSPKTSYYKYYWNTQWNQFLSRKEYDKEFAKTFGYKYFYLNGVNGDKKEDFEISDETGTIHGEGDKMPDADLNEGAGMIVGGSQVQELGDIHIHHNGNNGASLIAKNSGKVHINNLYVDIKTQKNRWYFFCFPFDINPGEATFDGSSVWYLYDGEARAQNGNGGWKKVAADGVMKAGNGYIFQGAVNGTLSIHVADVTIDGSDSKTNMITYQSDNKNDASWNLIGNPNMAYYDMDNLNYDAPITVYNNETGNYEAVRPGDDSYEFYPFQAFFVQKPEGAETMDFDATKKETKNKSDKKKAAKAKTVKTVSSMRKVINLELASADMANDTEAAATDRTRIVVNPTKSVSYETECDAAKFIADNMPQIYSIDKEGCAYSINERPAENGIIDIAVKAPKDGVYTISASRIDCPAKLRDLEAGTEVDLAEGGYTFASEAMTYTKRFQLILADVVTSVKTIEDAKAAVSVEAGAISINDANAEVKVYAVGGAMVASQKGAGKINVPAGTYVVKVNGQSVKVNVNE